MDGLDPSIALSYKPTTALESPHQSQMKMLSLKDAMLGQQIQQGQLQTQQYQLKKAQDAEADQKAYDETMRTAVNADGTFNGGKVLKVTK